MGSLTVEELYERYVKPLSEEERRQLIVLTEENLGVSQNGSASHSSTSGTHDLSGIKRGRKWSEICGEAEHPLAGEDAQQWVSRSRRESDEDREFPR
jgi:hypothetical protein